MIVRSDEFLTNPVVTCSIVSYNQKQWIGQCIEGMLAQKFDLPYTIVISDDCSTDGTQEVLKEYQARYPDRIKLVLNEKNCGVGPNWAKSCKAMEGGEYIAFCDGDDFWSLPEKLQIQYDYMRAHPECVGMTTGCDKLDADGVLHCDHSKYGENPQPQVITQRQLWERFSNINICGAFCRKDLFDKHVPLDAYIEQEFPVQDWPTMLVMAAYGEIHFLPIFSFTYRLGHVSESHPSDINKLERKMQRGTNMYNYLHTLFPDLPYKETNYEEYASNVLLQFSIKTGNYAKAKQYARLCGKRTLRERCCSNYVTFQMYRWLKRMSNRVRK